MALGFGGLHKLYGIVTYRVSPMHLKAYHGALSHGVPNMVRRFLSQVPYVGPPLLIGAGVYYGVDYLYYLSMLKNPEDYCDDE